ncbi:DUF5677 domain-containing protein [Paenibacillus polymyxa]|uniref:DUF5677 domain-containing protein n=1 Tax=Paenibacillus polymyxa TaxID=1406 RepID=UPI002AB3833E|nr:DUF5677 domain-containing protein [Paenibacillus polymyxa]MDY8095862.1 DUF5677 domain-containing protein [Paenibacillus polymyxa]
MQENRLDDINLVIKKITTLLLREGVVIRAPKEYPYLPHIMALFAKQTNLLESIILLYQENLGEEAVILFRSLLNNCMLIHYLLDDKDGTKLKEFTVQPIKNHLNFLLNIKRSLKKGWFPEERAKKYRNLNKMIKDVEKKLEDKGFSAKPEALRPLSISTLSKTSRQLSLMYQTYYMESSKYEHSDYSVLGNYIHEYEESDKEIRFSVTTYLADEKLNDFSLNTSLSVYFKSFFAIITHLINCKVDLWNEQEKLNVQQLTLDIVAIQGVDLEKFIAKYQ